MRVRVERVRVSSLWRRAEAEADAREEGRQRASVQRRSRPERPEVAEGGSRRVEAGRGGSRRRVWSLRHQLKVSCHLLIEFLELLCRLLRSDNRAFQFRLRLLELDPDLGDVCKPCAHFGLVVP